MIYMKTFHKATKLLAIAMAMALALAITACDTAPGTAESTTATAAATGAAATDVLSSESTSAAMPKDFGAAAAATDTTLTIMEMMVYAIQDEYLARAEYELIMEIYGSQTPFSNIIRAEESHISTLKTLFATYGFDIPEDTAASHTISPDSLNDSYKAGVHAEIVNIDMYARFLEQELPDDVRTAFEELLRGSENHLAAFERKVK